jgi:hypothetical protein
MEDLTPETDVVAFARALRGWVGAHAATYAEERSLALRNAGDAAGAHAWSRVAEAARQLQEAERKQANGRPQSKPTAVATREGRRRRVQGSRRHGLERPADA